MTPIQLKQSNYLENDIIASYLNIFEYETYFTSIRYKDFSRKEYDKAINVLTNFLMKTNNDDAIYQLNEAIFSRRFEGDIYSPASNYYKSLNISKIENIALFNLDNTTLFFKELTFESIKKQYKKAAMRHHPDKGGSTEDMKKLNKLLIELNDYVKASTLDVVSSEVDEKYLLFGIKSFEDYYCLLNIILFNIYLDEWNAEKAYSTFKEIDDYYCKEKNEELFYVFYDETDYAYKLARILTIANMNIEALDVFNRANSALSSRNHYLAYKNIYLKLDSSKEEIKAIIKKAKRKCQDDLIGVINSIYGIKKLRFVINHFRKAENCYRLGIINQTQYKKSIDRLIKDHQVLMGKEIAVNDYLISELFASLPTCSSTPIQIKIHSNIEWPKYYAGEYYIRFNQLSDEQKMNT